MRMHRLLWALAKTPRLIERTEIHEARPARRRAARSGITTPVVLFDIRLPSTLDKYDA